MPSTLPVFSPLTHRLSELEAERSRPPAAPSPLPRDQPATLPSASRSAAAAVPIPCIVSVADGKGDRRAVPTAGGLADGAHTVPTWIWDWCMGARDCMKAETNSLLVLHLSDTRKEELMSGQESRVRG